MTSPGSGAPPLQPGPHSLLVSGQRFGPFTVIGLLGRGGMGEVYEAEEVHSGRHVALKLFNRSLGDEDERQRFLREGQLAATISHPNCVCVFGADEICGLPVISMELASGGTVKDLLKERGPLPIAEAVDITLQIVAGLEAAASLGVLHRDIKPANCFVNHDGVVKVGDFGLSISTLARDETHLTLAGTIVGTPAFASPEQLRGDALDLRADIYSVGATLHCLLTGRAPFEETNILKLVTMVAQVEPPRVDGIRPGVPRKLAAVIARCLAKRPAGRFGSYAELRAALLPFASRGSERAAASRRLRAVAWILDGMIAGLVSQIAGVIFFAGTKSPLQSLLVYAATAGAYFTVMEGRWAASVGKQFFGLELSDEMGRRPSFQSVIRRTVVFVLGPYLVVLLGVAIIAGPMSLGSRSFTEDHGSILSLAWWLLSLAMFVTARRTNGFAGVHELASGTRVVFRLQQDEGPVSQLTAAVTVPDDAQQVGPYTRLSAGDAHSCLVPAYDPALKRRVWLNLDTCAELPPASRRDLNRPGRLRWLAGRRQGSERWDAYEALDGTSFSEAVGQAQPWRVVRRWTQELAAELVAGGKDGTLPVLARERLWVAGDGRIVLLDLPVLGTAMGSASATALKPLDFLREVVRDALRGALVPLSARKFLDELESDATISLEKVVETLCTLEHRPGSVPQRVRAAHLAVTGSLPLLVSVVAAGALIARYALDTSSPGSPMVMLVLLVITWVWTTWGIVACVFALVARGGLALRASDMAVVNRRGEQASRLRCFARALAGWSPVFVAATICTIAVRLGDGQMKHVPTAAAIFCAMSVAALMALFAFGAVCAIRRPEGGLQDRLAGTFLVPR